MREPCPQTLILRAKEYGTSEGVATNLWAAALVLYLTKPRIVSGLKYKPFLID